MPIRPEDIPKTAFKTRWGLFEYLGDAFWCYQCPSAVDEDDE